MKVLTCLRGVIHVCLLVLGAATAVSLAWFHVVLWYEGQPSPVAAMPRIDVSPVAQRAAALVSPALQDVARQSEEAIVASAGGSVKQWATRQVYPYAVEKIPVAAEVGCDRLLSQFGAMPVSEIAAWLVEHASSKGRVAHWSVRAAAERGTR